MERMPSIDGKEHISDVQREHFVQLLAKFMG